MRSSRYPDKENLAIPVARIQRTGPAHGDPFAFWPREKSWSCAIAHTRHFCHCHDSRTLLAGVVLLPTRTFYSLVYRFVVFARWAGCPLISTGSPLNDRILKKGGALRSR